MSSKTLAKQLHQTTTTSFINYALEKERWRHRYSVDKDTLILPDLEDIRAMAMDFVHGHAVPLCPKRIQISKLGSDKKRILYVYPTPTRLMLKTVHYCLNQKDSGLSPHCLAFRPGYSIHRAFRKIISAYRSSEACIRIDIKNYFNSIPAKQMISVLEQTHSDEPGLVFSLSQMLKDPQVIENHTKKTDTQKGVMAGMPLSPYLANHYLNSFDRLAAQRARVYARYSDDMIFFCSPEDTNSLYQWIEEQLYLLGLKINENKSEIIAPESKWSFLGLSCHNGHIGLSDGSIKKMKGKISRASRKLYRWKIRKNASTERAARALIRKFQYKFYGTENYDDEKTWSRWYFPLLTDASDLKKIDQHLQRHIRYLASGNHSKKNYKTLPYQKLKALGYIPLTTAYYKRNDILFPQKAKKADSESAS